MSASNIKDLRKQIKNVVQGLLPQVLKEEMFKVLQNEIRTQIQQIEAHVKETMHQINERNKDVSAYVVRQVTPTVPAPEAPKQD